MLGVVLGSSTCHGAPFVGFHGHLCAPGVACGLVSSGGFRRHAAWVQAQAHVSCTCAPLCLWFPRRGDCGVAKSGRLSLARLWASSRQCLCASCCVQLTSHDIVGVQPHP